MKNLPKIAFGAWAWGNDGTFGCDITAESLCPMSKIRFTHKIMVPNHKYTIEESNGYDEEMKDVKVYTLSQNEYDDLRREGGLFDIFDRLFGTIIDDCEEDRLSSNQIAQAIELTKNYFKNNTSSNTCGLDKVLESLIYAKSVGTFWEIVNGAELYE